MANNEVSEDDWDLGPGPSSSVVAPPRRAGDLRSEGESESEDWDLEDDWKFDASEDERTGSDEAEAARCDFVNLKGGQERSDLNNAGSSSSHQDAHALLGEVVRRILPEQKQKVSTCRHKRIPTIYKIMSPVDKGYVGQTVWLTGRMAKHMSGDSQCTIIAAAGKKYGWENMRWSVLRGGPDAVGGAVSESELDYLEVEYIESEGTLAPNGYNIQKGGKVAWRGVSGLSRHDPRGPRSEETKQALRDRWDAKREERLSGMDEEQARRLRNYAATQSESRRAKQTGEFEDKRFKPSAARTATWDAKREAKLALLPPEEAAKKRAESDKKRKSAMRYYNRKKGRE
jgi:group I intron endonuclease